MREALYTLNERLWPALLGDVLGVDLTSRAGDSLAFFLYDTVKILLLLVGLIFVVGLLRTTLSPERVRAFLTGRGLVTGLVLAAALGAVTPFCSCSSVPIFIGFVEAGIPLAATQVRLDRLGRPIQMRWSAAFQMVNQHCRLKTGQVTLEAPEATFVPAPIRVEVQRNSSGDVRLMLHHSTAPGEGFWRIRLSPDRTQTAPARTFLTTKSPRYLRRWHRSSPA